MIPPDLALLLAMLALIAWHALDLAALRLLTPPQAWVRARLAWDLWRDPWLHYGPLTAWRTAGILAPMGAQVARRWR